MENKMQTQYVDMTPTWREILPALIALLDNPQTQQTALDELTKMAGAADRYISLVKADRIKAEA
jgi:hypothetical protein